jgi:hypothetical protein
MPTPTISGPREDPDGSSSNSSHGILTAMFKSNGAPATAPQTQAAQSQAPQTQPPQTQPPQTQVASADASDHSSFFSNWFKPKADAAPQPPAAQGTPLAGLKPAAAPRKTDAVKPDAAKPAPQVAEAPKLRPTTNTAAAATPKPQSGKSQQDANAAPPANNGGLMKGAQPVVPTGSFDGRWAGLQ